MFFKLIRSRATESPCLLGSHKGQDWAQDQSKEFHVPCFPSGQQGLNCQSHAHLLFPRELREQEAGNRSQKSNLSTLMSEGAC